jgi:hypothetical protein
MLGHDSSSKTTELSPSLSQMNVCRTGRPRFSQRMYQPTSVAFLSLHVLHLPMSNSGILLDHFVLAPFTPLEVACNIVGYIPALVKGLVEAISKVGGNRVDVK